jgi:peptidoglycan-N-acetylglucosamine deacetylase
VVAAIFQLASLLVLAAGPASNSASPRHAFLLNQRTVDLPTMAEAKGTSVKLPLNMILSADRETLLATLTERGWSPRGPDCSGAAPEDFQVEGRAPDLVLERPGPTIEQRYTLRLWVRPEEARNLSLWVGSAASLGGVRPLKKSSQLLEASQPAVNLVIADLSFGVSQARMAVPKEKGLPRIPWVELRTAPEEAEQLVQDLEQEPLDLSDFGAKECGPGEYAPLPPPRPIEPVVYSCVAGAGKRVALTFDACSTLDSSLYDPKVIQELIDNQVPATLFVSGRWAETHLDEMRMLAEQPLFEIGNHAYVHPHMTELPESRQREELLWAQEILYSLTGQVPRFFRPPYGEYDQDLVKVAASLGLATVEYDFASGDADQKIPTKRFSPWVLLKTRPGSIVVMHMNRLGRHTAEFLPDVIKELRGKGFVLSKVGELVGAQGLTRACQ